MTKTNVQSIPKNTQHGDIKSHQYIISFDPRDAADNGLTMEKAQALGLKFCEENFPGHPAIVCTHPDGHNHSGNIHVHIVIGSVRTREVERKPYMQKPRDWLEGMKHSSTAQTMRHLRVEVMELCEGAGLYQIDLLNGSKGRVSEAEYWARRRGQQKLDLANAALAAAGQQPKQKKFETVKDTLRKQISSVLYLATSFEDFSDRLMQQHGIAVLGGDVDGLVVFNGLLYIVKGIFTEIRDICSGHRRITPFMYSIAYACKNVNMRSAIET